jgi:hypothetical protein
MRLQAGREAAKKLVEKRAGLYTGADPFFNAIAQAAAGKRGDEAASVGLKGARADRCLTNKSHQT